MFSIHKLGWDKLTTNENNNTLHQCVSVQFKLRENKKTLENKKELHNPGNFYSISRIPPPILLRPSKKALEKSKFYKGKNKEFDHKMSVQKE